MKRVLCVGHAVQDYVFNVATLPTQAEKYRATGFTTVGGGPAATAAVAIAKLGGAALLAARVGDDPVATTMEQELRGYGVDCQWLRRCAGRQSSLSAVFVDAAGERMIVNHTDPQMPREADWLDEIPLDDVAVVLGDVRWPEGSARLLARARAAGLPAVLDADVPAPRDDVLLRAATHLAFSTPGLRELTGIADPGAAIEQVAQRYAAWCCVTLGAEGVLCRDGRTPQAKAVTQRVAAFTVEPVDTLGAGDVWHGAFALALAEGAEELAAARAASAAAAIKVTRPGGRSGAPTRAERDRLLEQA
jgi:sulfofructose kinase